MIFNFPRLKRQMFSSLNYIVKEAVSKNSLFIFFIDLICNTKSWMNYTKSWYKIALVGEPAELKDILYL